MNKLAITSAFALAFAVAPSASAQLVGATTLTSGASLATNTTSSLTTWTGAAGTYEVFAPLSPEQQAAELRGAIRPSEATPGLPETRVTLPAYKPGVEALPYGYGTTDVITRVAQSEACPTGATPIANYTKVWQRSATYGNTTFGSGYLAKFTLGMQGVAGSNDKLYGETVGNFHATLLGKTGSVEGRSYGQVQGATASRDIYFKAAGATLYSSAGGGSLTYSKSWTKTLVSASTTIWVGPVPVTVNASAPANLSLNASLGFASSKLSSTVTPKVTATATVSSAVSLPIASTGVSGTMNLINVSVPTVKGLKLTPMPTGKSTFAYDVDVDVVLHKSLSGTIQLSTKLWYLFGSKTWTTTLANWSGLSATYPVVDLHGCTGSFSL